MSAALPMLKVGDVYSKQNEIYKGKYLIEIFNNGTEPALLIAVLIDSEFKKN